MTGLARDRWQRVRHRLFGDRYGFALFLGSLCFVMLYWRAGIFITDTATLVRTLEALSEGRFWIERVSGDSFFNAPGASARDGRIYGRNYGQLFLTLPFLWLLKAIDALANIRVALIALWHLLLLAFLLQLSKLRAWSNSWVIIGSALILGFFVANLASATAFVEVPIELLALQVTAAIATAFIAVIVYRLLWYQYGQQVGLYAGAASVLVLPVGFWATLPKRHVFSALACVLILYFIARSREANATTRIRGIGPVPHYRAAAYATVGLLTWIHAGEGLFVFLTLFLADMLTAPSNDRRTLGFVFGIFAISLLPTVLTNLAVTGSPVEPPRILSGGLTDPATASGGGGGAGGSGGGQTDSTGGVFARLFSAISNIPPIDTLLWMTTTMWGIAGESLAVLRDTARLSRIFLRSSGSELSGGNIQFAAANLSVVESAPILGGLIGVVFAWGRSISLDLRDWVRGRDPTRSLAWGIIIAILLIYLSKLPLHVQINQRYLLPIYPLGLYLIGGSAFVRNVLDSVDDLPFHSYIVGVGIGTPLLTFYITSRDLAVAEAAQVHAKIGLMLAFVLAIACIIHLYTDRFERMTAIAFGLTGAAGTAFLLMSGILYFDTVGTHVLPIIQELSRLL